MTNIEEGRDYSVSELKSAGYVPSARYRFSTPNLATRFGEAVIVQRGSDRFTLVTNGDRLKPIIHFNPDSGKPAEIFLDEEQEGIFIPIGKSFEYLISK